MPRRVGIVLFDDVEVLDFAGPFEVFALSEHEDGTMAFEVRTLSETGGLVRARGGLRVQPDHRLTDAPHLDIVVVPGGPGAREREMANRVMTDWIAARMTDVDLMTSVCTGALLLAQAGLLSGRRATTHWASLDRLEREFPDVAVQRAVRIVDEGAIVTSAGVSAGIDMALHVVRRLLGADAAARTAQRMEYDMT